MADCIKLPWTDAPLGPCYCQATRDAGKVLVISPLKRLSSPWAPKLAWWAHPARLAATVPTPGSAGPALALDAWRIPIEQGLLDRWVEGRSSGGPCCSSTRGWCSVTCGQSCRSCQATTPPWWSTGESQRAQLCFFFRRGRVYPWRLQKPFKDSVGKVSAEVISSSHIQKWLPKIRRANLRSHVRWTNFYHNTPYMRKLIWYFIQFKKKSFSSLFGFWT